MIIAKVRRRIRAILLSELEKRKFRKCLHGRHGVLIIYDLDNTLARPDFDLFYQKELLYGQAEYDTRMFNLLNEQLMAGEKVVVLSARDWKFKSLTHNWLKKGLKAATVPEIFFVARAEHKLYFLQYAVKQGFQVFYYDDLSYNHEHGEVRLYQSIIDRVKALPLTYYGLDYINTKP